MDEAQESISGSTKATSSLPSEATSLCPNMEHTQTGTNKERRNTQISSESTAIIPGLPDDVGLSILARLPRFLQHRHRVICHAWKDALESARMDSLRKALHISEEWPVFDLSVVYQFVFSIVDPFKPRRYNIPLPQELELLQRPYGGRYCTVLGAIGSEVLIACICMNASEKDAELQGVYSFDGLRMKWADSKYSALPNSLGIGLRYSHASATDMDGGYLYVVGRFGLSRSAHGIARLDTKARMWETLPDPHVKREGAAAFVLLQGLFHLIGGWHVNDPHDPTVGRQVHNSGEIWDPANQQWTLMPELWPSEVFESQFDKRRIAVLKDQLYALRQGLMTEELMHYESVSKSWASLGCVPLHLSHPHYQLLGLTMVRLLARGEELSVIDRLSGTCIATKPTFSQPIVWKALSHTDSRALMSMHWDCMVAALHV